MRQRARLRDRHRLQRQRDRALQLAALGVRRRLLGDLQQLAAPLAAQREDRRAPHRHLGVAGRRQQQLDVRRRRARGELVGDLRPARVLGDLQQLGGAHLARARTRARGRGRRWHAALARRAALGRGDAAATGAPEPPPPFVSSAKARAMRGFSTDHIVHGRSRGSTPASASASASSVGKRSASTASRPPIDLRPCRRRAERVVLADEPLHRARPVAPVADVLAQHAARVGVAADRHPAEHADHVVRRVGRVLVAVAQPQLQRAGAELQVERERRVVVVAVVELAVPARVVEHAVHEQRVGDRAVGVQRPEIARPQPALQLAERIGGIGERRHPGSHRTIVPGITWRRARRRGAPGAAAARTVCGRLESCPLAQRSTGVAAPRAPRR